MVKVGLGSNGLVLSKRKPEGETQPPLIKKQIIIIFMKKVLGELVLALFIVFIASFVTAWGYQVFWNEVALNVWQMFTSCDVINTMQISYGACLAIAVSTSLIYSKKSEKTKEVSEAAVECCSLLVSRIIMILITLLVTGLVF